MDDDLYSADVPQRSPFSRLPHELLVRLAQLLHTPDFCALRLASRQISSVLRVLLAREDFIGVPWRDNAARLDALVSWPECAQQIRRVRVRSRAVYADEEEMAWNEGLADPEPQLRKAAAARQLAAQHPKRLRITPLRAETLCEALSRLPNLEELALTWGRFPFLSRADLGLDWELGFDGADADADADAAELRRQLEYTTGGWQTEMLVDLATDAPPLRVLKIAPLALEAMDRLRFLPLVTNVFHSLARLDLRVTARTRRVDPEALSKLGDVLAATWALRELRLDLDDNDDDYCWRFLPFTTLKGLRVLTLVRAAPNLGELAAFLQRHAGSLRELELLDVRGARRWPRGAPGLCWRVVFDVVRDELRELTRVRLRGYFADKRHNIRFKEDEKEDEDERIELGLGEDREGWREKRLPIEAVVDPEPLERYLLRRGEYPTLEWNDHMSE